MIAPMRERVILDVIDRPGVCLLSSFRHLRALRSAQPSALRAPAAGDRDLTQERHTGQHFLRLRPLAERGSLSSVKPFAEVLGRERSAVAQV
jgi:hypothetical protein